MKKNSQLKLIGKKLTRKDLKNLKGGNTLDTGEGGGGCPDKECKVHDDCGGGNCSCMGCDDTKYCDTI
jgi:hypothetical protein